MRIIGGIHKGRHLPGKLPHGIRPTLDAVRESLFNIISNYYDMEDLILADICAGSGAIGTEALSRGAKKVFFVDKSHQACNYIQKNLDLLKVPKSDYEILQIDALKAPVVIKGMAEEIDFIFTDPPYDSPFLNSLIQEVSEIKILEEDGIFAVETGKDEAISIPETFSCFRERKYGGSKIFFLEWAE